MNRRDALKSLAAVAAGGSLPAAGFIRPGRMTRVVEIPCIWTHGTDMTCLLAGGKVIKWLTPEWQRTYWSPEFAEQVRAEKEEIARKNAANPKQKLVLDA